MDNFSPSIHWLLVCASLAFLVPCLYAISRLFIDPRQRCPNCGKEQSFDVSSTSDGPVEEQRMLDGTTHSVSIRNSTFTCSVCGHTAEKISFLIHNMGGP